MAVTRADAVVDALVAALSADSTLAGLVLDGPPVTEAVLDDVVTVGFGWDPEDETSIDFEQEYHELGPAAKRDERVEVRCAAVAFRGDADMAAARARCVVLLGAVESVLRATPSLGLDEVLRTEVAFGSFRQAQTAQGAECVCTFTVTATSLI